MLLLFIILRVRLRPKITKTVILLSPYSTLSQPIEVVMVCLKILKQNRFIFIFAKIQT